MPQLIIRNIKKNEFATKAPVLSKNLTSIIGCPEDWITISYVENTLTFVEGVDKTENNIFIEVKWFERPEEIKVEVAKILNDTFSCDGRDIMINFVILEKDRYFENGEYVH